VELFFQGGNFVRFHPDLSSKSHHFTSQLSNLDISSEFRRVVLGQDQFILMSQDWDFSVQTVNGLGVGLEGLPLKQLKRSFGMLVLYLKRVLFLLQFHHLQSLLVHLSSEVLEPGLEFLFFQRGLIL
jgi:hypothetical protein